MAEEAKGQKFSFQDGGRLGARIGDQGSTQTQGSTQSTGASDTSGVQSSGVFLPGISGVNNKVDNVVKSIQSGKIQTNVQLPGITDKTPTYPNATMTAMTPDEIDELEKIAKKNGTYRESWNDIIHEEMLSNEYKQLLKQGVIQTWNDVKKFSYRKGAELVDYFTNHPFEAVGKYVPGMGGPFNIWGKLADTVAVDSNPAVKNASNAVSKEIWKGYYKYEDKINKNFEKWVDKNINKTLAEEYQNSGGIWESIKNWDTDNIKYGLVQGFSTSVLPMTPGIIAGIATRNPYITAGVAFGSTAPIEDQEAYEEAIKEGATREQATDIGKYAGIINGALETVGEFLQIKGLLKPLKKNITKEITKKTTRQIITRGLKEYVQGVGSEALTEGTQELVTNALIKTINENKDLFENVLDSIIVGGALSAGPSTLGAGGKVMQDVQNNEIIDQKTDLEALDYVLEGEKRKAQRIEQQKEKMRQRANAIKNPTLDNGYTPTQEEAEQRAKENEEREQFEQERDDEYNREMQIENDMMNEVLSEGDLNEDLGDPRYQKKEISATDESEDSSSLADQSPASRVNISPENSSEISKNLNEIKKNLEDLKSDTFLQQIKKSITGNEKGSNYIINKIDGKKYVLRVADHSANGYQFDNSKQRKRNTSIVIKLAQKSKFKKSKNVDLVEFVYNPENMTTEKMQGIIDGIQNWIKTGEYTDTNYDSKNQSTRKRGENKTEEKYQLKYEEEGYNPGVAGKNEKNISGKEGVNLRNKLNKKTVKELAEKYGIKVEVIEGMIKILENGKRKGYAYGKYIDQLLTLSEQIKESTAPHELLHAIFDMIDPETKTYLISQVMKSEGWSASKAEERLADSFSNFFRTGKIEGAPKSTWGKIKIFFKRVRSFINGMGKWRNQLDEIFTDIIESEGIEDLQGKIDRNESINKAKERMRERFKQYQKNAQKMQKKEESKNKYQKIEDQTQSKAFKKRFGDSKVVDENGNPLVVYHGTEMKFNTFGRGNGEHGKGFYFTDDMDYAEEFSGEDGNTMEVYLKMVKPLRENVDMNSKEMKNLIKGIKEKRGLSEKEIKDCFGNEDWSSELSSKIAKKMGYGKKDVEKTVGWEFEDIDEIGETDYNAYLGAYAWENGLNDLVRESGFDGIISKIYNSDAEGLEYIAFKPNQIKSATDNVGTYDANNDDIRYQKADIDPEATSPEQLVEVNDKGLDVMVKFVSEKQKKNATDVNKELLTTDGKPYMWTSTNKYKSKVITDWRNVEDSKYKEYTDKGIQVARFTNNSSMSYSYADYKSKLAPVKKFKSIDELNKFFKENPNNYERILGNGIDDGVLKSSVVYEMKENDGKFELISNSTETLTQSMKDFYDGINNDWFGGNIGEMPENKDEALKKLQEYYNEHDYEIDGERTVKLLKNGNVERTVVKEPTVYKRFDTKLDALAEGYTIAQEADLYHYQGVIQKMKNPLVVDIRSKDNTPSTWSRLGTVNDIFDKEGINYNKEVDYYIRDVEEAMDGFSERMKALEQYWNDAYRDDPYGEVSQFMGNVQLSANNGVTYMVDELEDLLNDPAMGEDLKIGLDTEVYGDLRDYGRTLRDVIIELRNFINTDRNYYALKKLSPEGIESWVKDMGAPKEVVKMIKNKNWKDMLGNWRDIGDKGWRENIKELLTTNGMDLETNDWVRYALDSGKYDGVIFKNIIDYGGLPKEGWENAKGGDVAVTFRSNQFKTWDNEDPTDSRYIRFQKAGDIESEAFKKRFGDWENDPKNASKVVDENGKPLAVIHETYWDALNEPKGKAVFDKNRSEIGGFRFSDIGSTPGYEYGDNKLKVYLNMRNPLIIEEEHYPGRGTIIGRMMEGDYDGVIVKGGTRMDGKPHTVYVVREPNQIKSATDNVGTYDINNEDIRYQRVYHGTKADFDRFDSSHMGEGEGAQAHGWGHYVAVEERTGRYYAEMGGGYGYDYSDNDNLDTVVMINRILDDLNMYGGDVKDVIDSMREGYKSQMKGLPEEMPLRKGIQKEIDTLNSIDIKKFKTGNRYLYEIEIPDPVKADTPTGSNYIEENGGLTLEQRKDLIKRLREKNKDNQHYQLGVNYLENMLYGSQFKGDDTRKDIYRYFSDGLLERPKEASKALEEIGYDGIHYFGGRDGEAYVIFDDNDLEIKNHEKYQKTEYEYDENGKPKWIKFGEDNEFDPSIFGENTKEEQIEEDKENEKENPFYDAWMKYNNQNYKDDQITLAEFMDAIGKWGEKQQDEYDQKMRDIVEAENDPKMLELQLKAVKLMEKEQNVGKKFGKNVSKEVRDKQQAEVEKEREELVKEIFEWMYPGLKFEDATYDDMKMADEKEAEWEMLGRGNIEEKLKFFKKDKNGNWEKKNIKIENPNEKLDKIIKSGNFDEIIEPTDRVIEWKTPEGQKGRIDKTKDPKKFKSVMEKINSGKTKTKVELKDVTNEVRALERYKENEKAEKERRKKEKQEEFAKKKQEEYKRMVRMKAFQKLVDMQRFEKYPFLTEEEIKNRYGFSDQEWKTITEQEEIKLPKKRGEKAISDFNKAVDDQVKYLIEGLNWQNRMKQKEAEKNLGEIGEIDLDVLLGKDEEKGAREVEEFEKLAKEEKKKSKKEKNKRLEQAREDVTQVEIDKERENSKSEKERVDKIIKSTKTDNTVWGSIKKTASDIITPVSTRIREISPKIYRELMRYFQNKDILTNQRLKEIDPFLKTMGKIRKENPVRFMDIWVALANRNIGYANGLLQEYGVKVPTKLLDTIFDEAEDVGLNINYLGSYYPLSVKAPKSFLEELMKVGNGDIASEIEKRIQQESQKKGGPLDESEITAIINSVIAGEEKGPDVNLGNKHMKKRNTEIERTPKMLEYCDDPISTLITYIEGMTQSIERAKFLGKSRSGNVHTLADYVYNVKNGLDPTQQDELMELLKSVFNDASPNKFYQTWRDIATLTTLGSPSSTLTQIADLSFSIYENGWREALKATWDIFMKRKAFDLQDMGVINRGEEYTNINSQKNLLQKAIHNVFKLTFFSNFDTFGKSTFIQSTWNKRRKRALKGENGDPQLIKDIMKITDDEYLTYKIINDLRNGVFSEDVALVMYMKLGNIQPLTKAQMPKTYLDNPNGRLFYQFKTFGIKQLDYVLQETKEQTKGFKNLSTTEKFLRVAQIASMIFIMTLMGAGASELKDITMRRRSNSILLRWLFGEDVGTEQVWDKVEDSALQLFGLSRYTVMQMKSDPVDAITNLFTTFPATNLIAYPFKDINKAFKDDGSINWSNPSSYQLIPVVGKYRYWIYGGGQEKQQEALDKENKKKTTTSGGSSRSTRNTRSRNRNTRNSR